MVTAKNIKIDIAIIGAPKCGSTSLYEFLSGQSCIKAIAEAKDFPVFSRPLDTERRLERLAEFGYSAISDLPQCIGDANICFKTEFLKKLKIHTNDVKVILLMRNPLQRMKSSHRFNTERLIEDRSFIRALNDEVEGNFSNYSTKDFLQKSYIQHTEYKEMVDNCRDIFGEENLLVVDFDDLIGCFPLVVRQLEKFLQVNFNLGSLLPKANVTSGQMRYKFLSKILFQGQRSSGIWILIRLIFNQKLRSKIRFFLRDLNRTKSKNVSYSDNNLELMSPETVNELKRLENEYSSLKKHYGINTCGFKNGKT